MTGRLKQPIWLVPLFIAGVVAGFGWWGNLRLRDTIERQVTAELTTNLNANVTALEIWMTNQTKLATVIAAEPRIHNVAAKILENPAGGRAGGPISLEEQTNLNQFANFLRPRLAEAGYTNAQLISTNMLVVDTVPRRGFFGPVPVSEAHTNQLAELFSSGAPVIITPYIQPAEGPRRGGRNGQGLWGTAEPDRAERTARRAAAADFPRTRRGGGAATPP